MKTLSITELHAHSEHRPPGYVEDIIARGTLEGDRLRLTDEAFNEIRRKYASAGPVEAESLLSKLRLEICQICEYSEEQALVCKLYKGCCFGSWRRQSTSVCPATPPKWPAIVVQPPCPASEKPLNPSFPLAAS